MRTGVGGGVTRAAQQGGLQAGASGSVELGHDVAEEENPVPGETVLGGDRAVRGGLAATDDRRDLHPVSGSSALT